MKIKSGDVIGINWAEWYGGYKDATVINKEREIARVSDSFAELEIEGRMYTFANVYRKKQWVGVHVPIDVLSEPTPEEKEMFEQLEVENSI